MKFYSESLNKMFDSQEACAKAENEHAKAVAQAEAKKKELVEQRTSRAKEVEKLYKAAAEAKKAYDVALKKFIKDYGSFHATFSSVDPFFSLFDLF